MSVIISTEQRIPWEEHDFFFFFASLLMESYTSLRYFSLWEIHMTSASRCEMFPKLKHELFPKFLLSAHHLFEVGDERVQQPLSSSSILTPAKASSIFRPRVGSRDIKVKPHQVSSCF